MYPQDLKPFLKLYETNKVIPIKSLQQALALNPEHRPSLNNLGMILSEVLIEHGIITAADLGRLNDPAWCSRQEDLWWTQAS